jgi:hypothetical protein
VKNMRWAGHVARMGGRRGAYRVLVGETIGIETTCKTWALDGRIILKWVFMKWDGEHGLDCSGSG